MRWLAASAAAVFVLDQLSKWLVVHVLNLRTVGEIAVWPPFLQFHMAWNRGVNFGLFAQDAEAARWILIALASAVAAWLLWWAPRSLHHPVSLIAAGAIVGGALGNALDRAIYGAVADFLNMSCCGIANPYAFNVADIGIFAGAITLALGGRLEKNG